MVAVLYGTRFLTKRVSVRFGSNLRVIDRISFGRDSGLMVVSVCGKLCLIGVSATHTELLKEFDLSEAEYLSFASRKAGAGTSAGGAGGVSGVDKFPTFAEFLGNIGKGKHAPTAPTADTFADTPAAGIPASDTAEEHPADAVDADFDYEAAIDKVFSRDK